MEDVTGTVMLIGWCLLLGSILLRTQRRAARLEELARASETGTTLPQQSQNAGHSTRRWGRHAEHPDPNEEARLSGSWG